MTNTVTIAAAKLHLASTAELIEQYELAIASHGGRYTEAGRRQKRINIIVDHLTHRADYGDREALIWFER